LLSKDEARRIGVLMSRAASDPGGQARLSALQKGLQQLDLSPGRDVQVHVRWSPDDAALAGLIPVQRGDDLVRGAVGCANASYSGLIAMMRKNPKRRDKVQRARAV
jgi:hypothetical protein